MPNINFLNRYVESLRFWLPLYTTGQTKVFYYPRLRDNLYRHATIIVPGHCATATTGIGLDSRNHISLLTFDSHLINAYTELYREHIALCRPAFITHTSFEELYPCIADLCSKQSLTIQRTAPLSANTIPVCLLEQCLEQTDSPVWKIGFEKLLCEIPKFEEKLQNFSFIDISQLATADEVRAGVVPIAAPYITCDSHPIYTPESYVLHLKNILRLMDEYENYHFLPFRNELTTEYNLFVNEDGLALLSRNTPPLFMLEIRRTEMVNAFYEHLHRIAERLGYGGSTKKKIRTEIQALIRELQSEK